MCKRKDLGEMPTLPIVPKNPKKNLTQFIKNIITDEKSNSDYKLTGKMKDVEKIWNKFLQILIQNDIEIPKYPIWTDWWDNDLTSDNEEIYNKYSINKWVETIFKDFDE